MTWTCPNCGAVFTDQQTMKDHATTTCQRAGDSRTEQAGTMTRLSDFARFAKALPMIVLPGQRRALANAIDIEEKRAKAAVVGFDLDPVLADARRITMETPQSWAIVWPRVWGLAYDAACRGETPARVTVRWSDHRGFDIVPVEEPK